MEYEVIRNNRRFGPYPANVLSQMVSEGKVLRCDKVALAGQPYDNHTVGEALKSERLFPTVRSRESFFTQLKTIGRMVVPPTEDLRPAVWKEDSTLLMLAIVGLLPITLNILSGSTYLTFYTISLYFSAIWGLFFYYLFKTKQVSLKSTIAVFFLTQAFVFAAWDLLGIVRLNPFYALENSGTLVGDLLFYIGGVGLTEETAKALPLFIIMARAREPLIPQTMVYYGLMSGIAFGVFEGVQYQIQVNSEYGYAESFLANISRLTSLPFIHAIWAATAGYFVSFALLYPAYKWALIVLAIGIPALQHGLYDTLASHFAIIGWLGCLGIMFCSVIFLMGYLKRGSALQRQLSMMARGS